MSIDVKTLYPDEEEGFSFVSNYNPMIKAMGEVLKQVDDNDYQGDTRVLFKKGKKYGILIFGWGSCSGCDALQACFNFAELQELFDSLNNRIQWFPSKEKCLEYFNKHDWEGDYCWSQEETKTFVKECKELLK